MSLLTRMLSLKPGRTVIVGRTSSCRLNDLAANRCSLLGRGVAEVVDQTVFTGTVRRQIGADGDDRGENDGTEQAAEMVIDLILQAGIAGFVDADHGLQL